MTSGFLAGLQVRGVGGTAARATCRVFQLLGSTVSYSDDPSSLSYSRKRWDVLVTDAYVSMQDRDRIAKEELADVHVAITWHGLSGPRRNAKGSELITAAVSGEADAIGDPNRHPLYIPLDQGQRVAALYAVVAGLSAVMERQTNSTTLMDVSIADVKAYHVGIAASVFQYSAERYRRGGQALNRSVFPTGMYRCADGWIALSSNDGRNWRSLACLMDIDPDVSDPQERLRLWIERKTTTDLLAFALSHDITMAPVFSIDDLSQYSHFAERNVFLRSEIRGEADIGLPFVHRVEGSPTWPARSRRPRVIDLGWNWAGALVGRTLAEIGCDVIRVESVEHQEPLRLYPSLNLAFRNANRGKRSVALDLKEQSDRAEFLDLVGAADVVIESFSPGTMERLGLSPQKLLAQNPELTVLSSSIAGQAGPWAHLHGFAAITHALAGEDAVIGYQGEAPQSWTGTLGLADFVAAAWGVVIVQTALITGRTGWYDLSQLDALITVLADAIGLGHSPQDIAPIGEGVNLMMRRANRWYADTISVEEAEKRAVPTHASGFAVLNPSDAATGGFLVASIEDQRSDEHFAARNMAKRMSESRYWSEGDLYNLPILKNGTRLQGEIDAPGIGEHTRSVIDEWLGRDR